MNKFQPPQPGALGGNRPAGPRYCCRASSGARAPRLAIALTSIGHRRAIGLVLGLIAGYGPRWLDGMLVLLFDALSSLPMIFFALAVITVLGPGTGTLILVIVLVSVPGYARLIRAQTLSLARTATSSWPNGDGRLRPRASSCAISCPMWSGRWSSSSAWTFRWSSCWRRGSATSTSA